MQHGLGQAFGHADDSCILALFPALPKPGTDRFGAELAQPAVTFDVGVELPQQRLEPQFLQVAGFGRVGDVPVTVFILQEILFEQDVQFGQGLVLGLVQLLQEDRLQILEGGGLAAQRRFETLAQPLDGALLVLDEQS